LRFAVSHIADLDRTRLLAALYNYAAPSGLGYLQADPHDMTPTEAKTIFINEGYGPERSKIWDVKGRAIRSDFNLLAPNFQEYDATHALGAAAKVIRALWSGERPPVAFADWDTEIGELLLEENIDETDRHALRRMRARLRDVSSGASVYAFDRDGCMIDGLLIRRSVRTAQILDGQGRIRLAVSWRANGRVSAGQGRELLAAAGIQTLHQLPRPAFASRMRPVP
jgi:hypothetical protein